MLLAIDTATRAIGIALHDGGCLNAEYYWHGRGYHTVELAPEIALMLRRIGCSTRDLTAVAVATGPGSFTGLRIGMAFAKGLSLACQLDLIGIPTYEILAQAQPGRNERMLTVIKAGRARFNGLFYRWQEQKWVPDSESLNFTWPEMLASLEQPTYICGEIDQEMRVQLQAEPKVVLAGPAACVRRPGILADMGWTAISAGQVVSAAALVPVYFDSLSGKQK